MSNETETFTITYVVDSIIFRKEESNFYIVTLKNLELPDGQENRAGKSCIAKGEFPQSIREGDSFKSVCSWTYNDKYGWQLSLLVSFPVAPSNIRGIKRFLTRFIPHIGTSTADHIVTMYGTSAIAKLREDIKNIQKIPGVGKVKAEIIMKKLKEYSGIEDLAVFLFQNGVTNYMSVVTLYEELGDDALALIRTNPYALCDTLSTSYFSVADTISMKQGISFNDVKRLACLILCYVKSTTFSTGDMYVEYERLKQEFPSFVSRMSVLPIQPLDCSKFVEAVQFLVSNKRIVTCKTKDNISIIYPYSLYTSEVRSANCLLEIIRRSPISDAKEENINLFLDEQETKCGFKLDPLQRQAVIRGCTENISIITGGPGTGKTHTINMIIQFEQAEKQAMGRNESSTVEGKLQDEDGVVLSAPTGRAAKRMTELCNQDAITIHRLLGLTGQEHVDINELELTKECDVLIVDEFSMVDILLFDKLFSVLNRENIRIIIVGDVDQLPSVGPGMVLRDLIQSGVIPTTRLATLFRQAEESQIATNSHKIIKGINCNSPNGLTFDVCKQDFYFFRADDEFAYRKMLTRAIPSLIEKGRSMDDIMVLSPVRKGLMGVESLNPLLRDLLNPPSDDKEEITHGEHTLFRLGDRVMQIRNNYEIMWTMNYEGEKIEGLGVFNGEIGTITKINLEKEEIYVTYPDSSTAPMTVKYTAGLFKELSLAYAITIHKAQGSEFPITFLPALPFCNYNRNLLYTAVTRATDMVVLIGNEPSLNRIIATEGFVYRKSRLKELLQESPVIENTKDGVINE